MEIILNITSSVVILERSWTKREKNVYLDPGKKDDDRSHVVELDLQVGQRLEAGVSIVVLQQAFEKISNHGCSGYVHDNSNNTQLRNKQREQTRKSVKLVKKKTILKKKSKTQLWRSPQEWEYPDSSTGTWSNAAGGCGSPAPPPPRSTGWRGRMPPRTDPQSSPSWTHTVWGALSETARRSPPHR